MNRMMLQLRNQRRSLMRRVNNIATKHPFVGPALWILAVQYFVVQVIVTLAWPRTYNFMTNVISDLGATQCGMIDGRYVCSPLSWLMNISFVIIGITISIGSVLIYSAFKRSTVSKLAFLLMFVSGIGTIIVGVSPLDVYPTQHGIGAVPALLFGNIALILFAFSLRGIRKIFRFYTLVTGIVCSIAFVLHILGISFGIGVGNMERVSSFPYVIWLMTFGAYMSAVRLKAKRKS